MRGSAAADAARVEDLIRVAAVGAAEVHAQGRLEQVEPLEEERALLRKERLVRGQIEHELVRFHLSEIWVYGSDQRQIAGEVVSEVEAGADGALPPGIEHGGSAAA